MEISLVIPAHNEQARLNKTLELYGKCLQSRYPNEYEILVVANGCTDQTVQVANDYAATANYAATAKLATPAKLAAPAKLATTAAQVKVIDIPEPIGKGGAVLEGFRQATGRLIAFADADGATSPDSLMGIIDQLYDADIVIGSRHLPTSRIIQKQPLLRRVFSRAFNLSVRLLFHLPYRDTQCGAKAFKSIPAKNLSKLVKENKWAFDVDLLLWAKTCHYKVKEAPVVWTDQDGSKLSVKSTTREVVNSLWDLKRSNKIKLNYAKNGHTKFEKVQS